jgi:hypothetical protein
MRMGGGKGSTRKMQAREKLEDLPEVGVSAGDGVDDGGLDVRGRLGPEVCQDREGELMRPV